VLALAKTKDGAEVDGVLAKYELHSIGEIQTDIVLAAVSFEIAKLPNMKA
jgi:hypothetical protein